MIWLATALAILGASGAPSSSAPLLGAIRWDAWHTPWSRVKAGSADGPVAAVTRSLSPGRYHWRAPFFAREIDPEHLAIDGYTPAIMDREIAYAKAGGLDYWAFLLYDPDSAMTQALDLYRASAHRADLGFCGIASPATFGGVKTFDAGVARLADLLSEPGYVTVALGRPLLYLFDVQDKWIEAWGGAEAAAGRFRGLKMALRARGLREPYLVVLDFDPHHGAKVARIVGGQALSSYTVAGDGRDAPYSDLTAGARGFWERCLATGLDVVPIAVAGWDRRPRIEHPVPWESYQQPGVGMDRFYREPTPEQLAQHLGEALDWAAARPERCPAQTALVYAWNEHDEGGWLCPTLKAGGGIDDSRLAALAARRRNDPRRPAAGP
jgi:hypothetical protein